MFKMFKRLGLLNFDHISSISYLKQNLKLLVQHCNIKSIDVRLKVNIGLYFRGYNG